MVISRNRKDDKIAISAGVREHDSEEDHHCNMATAEIEMECSQPSCLGSVLQPAEEDTDESYLLNISNSG